MKNKGFSLIELMVSVAVMGLLITLVVAGFNSLKSWRRCTQREALATDDCSFLEGSERRILRILDCVEKVGEREWCLDNMK